MAESPTNPGVDILDFRKLSKIAKKHQLILIIDNCFAFAYLQTTYLSFGAGFSDTFWDQLMDGQGCEFWQELPLEGGWIDR